MLSINEFILKPFQSRGRGERENEFYELGIYPLIIFYIIIKSLFIINYFLIHI